MRFAAVVRGGQLPEWYINTIRVAAQAHRWERSEVNRSDIVLIAFNDSIKTCKHQIISLLFHSPALSLSRFIEQQSCRGRCLTSIRTFSSSPSASLRVFFIFVSLFSYSRSFVSSRSLPSFPSSHLFLIASQFYVRTFSSTFYPSLFHFSKMMAVKFRHFTTC